MISRGFNKSDKLKHSVLHLLLGLNEPRRVKVNSCTNTPVPIEVN